MKIVFSIIKGWRLYILELHPQDGQELNKEIVTELIDSLNDASINGAPWPVYVEYTGVQRKMD